MWQRIVLSADGRFVWDGQSARMSKCYRDCVQEKSSKYRLKRSRSMRPTMAEHNGVGLMQEDHFTNRIVKIFLNSNLSLILILLATILGCVALWLTPREEDPQIVVPLADIYVNFPGHSAAEVEQLIATPLERILY